MEIIEKIKNSKSMSGVIRIINNDENYYNKIVDITNYLNIGVSIHERLFNIKNKIFEKSYCPICNTNELEWNFKYKKYKNTCNNKKCKNLYLLINKDENIEMIRRQKISDSKKNKTKEEKDLIIQKMKKTNIDKYGKDSYTKTTQFKDNMIKNYGYVSPFELKETHDKSKLTILEKYGCDHNFKIDEVKEKKKKTFLDKYGADNPNKSKIVKEKIIKTNNDKYGGNSPMSEYKIREKARETYQLNYIDNEKKNE